MDKREQKGNESVFLLIERDYLKSVRNNLESAKNIFVVSRFQIHIGKPNILINNKKPTNMALEIGQKAPDFSLVSSEKEPVNLENYKGKNLLLLFFPMAFTGVCTAELCSTRDNIAVYNNADAEVLAVSVDSPFTLDKFKEDNSLNFTLASDFNKEASTAYDSIYDEFVLGLKGVSKRSAFVIDKEGTVQYAEVLESAGDLPDFDAIQAKLASL